MHIIIAEKDVGVCHMLNLNLNADDHKVSIAESGINPFALLKEGCTNIVLMDVLQCMYTSDMAPAEQKLTIRPIETSLPVLLVTCGSSDEELDDFTSPKDSCCDTSFDLLPAKVKNSILNKIQQMCSALRQGSPR